jgi:hypothetical protein
MMELLHSSEMSVLTRSARHNVPEDGILHFSDSFPVQNGLKQGDVLPPLLFNFALEYAITKIRENHVGLKLNGTHQLLAYADDLNLLREHRSYKEKHRNFD